METTKYLRRQAEQGDAEALFRLGHRLAFGRTRPRPTNWPAVLELWEQAAQLGHDRAMFYLGVCYEHGNGVAKNLTQALRWYEKAAQLDHEAAMYNLAFSYRNGDGVPQDYEQMRFWLVKAAELGDAASQRDLGWCYHEGVGVPLDYTAAVRWYKAAAWQGDTKAQYNLGLSYLNGDGVAVSERWGRYWLEKAARQGHREAKARLKRLGDAEPDLDAAYREMAQDEEREADALEWAEGTLMMQDENEAEEESHWDPNNRL